MFAADQYRLLDFGQGRRLEQFGPLRLDRPCPAAERVPVMHPELWPSAHARFERGKGQQGRWIARQRLPQRWTIRHGPVVLELKRTEFGHLGVFPEQASNWDWLAQQIGRFSQPIKVLNLFAYTGGSTLAAAAAGAEVVHVDSAENVVAWARRNAEHSALAHLPVRWICEDARKFVRRELRRGNRYDAVILDPPSYGHGPRGEVFRLSKHLEGLLEMCAELTAGRLRFVLLSAHTPKFRADRLARMVRQAFGNPPPGRISAEPMILATATGRKLPSGNVVRWEVAGNTAPNTTTVHHGKASDTDTRSA